jgi:hypothetical protein
VIAHLGTAVAEARDPDDAQRMSYPVVTSAGSSASVFSSAGALAMFARFRRPSLLRGSGADRVVCLEIVESLCLQKVDLQTPD